MQLMEIQPTTPNTPTEVGQEPTITRAEVITFVRETLLCLMEEVEPRCDYNGSYMQSMSFILNNMLERVGPNEVDLGLFGKVGGAEQLSAEEFFANAEKSRDEEFQTSSTHSKDRSVCAKARHDNNRDVLDLKKAYYQRLLNIPDNQMDIFDSIAWDDWAYRL